MLCESYARPLFSGVQVWHRPASIMHIMRECACAHARCTRAGRTLLESPASSAGHRELALRSRRRARAGRTRLNPHHQSESSARSSASVKMRGRNMMRSGTRATMRKATHLRRVQGIERLRVWGRVRVRVRVRVGGGRDLVGVGGEREHVVGRLDRSEARARDEDGLGRGRG